MRIGYAAEIIYKAFNHTLVETSELENIQKMCAENSVFKGQLADICGMTQEFLDNIMNSTLQVLNEFKVKGRV